jgi:hypothetical protein
VQTNVFRLFFSRNPTSNIQGIVDLEDLESGSRCLQQRASRHQFQRPLVYLLNLNNAGKGLTPLQP